MLKYFEYDHLPEGLREISKHFYDLAVKMNNELPEGLQKMTMFTKLLEAKDCAVRAALKDK